MRTSLIKRLLGISVLGLAAQAHAVVQSGHWSTITPTAGNFRVEIDQTLAGDKTGTIMQYASGQLHGASYYLDEGADFFVVQAGSLFNDATITSQHLPFLIGPSVSTGLSPVVAAVGQDFYLGARTRSVSDPGYGDDKFTSYGWAHFKVDASGLPQLIESAMAFRENGIVVGTLTVPAVPEPSSVVLAMEAGAAAVAWGLWRRRLRMRRQLSTRPCAPAA